MTQDTVFKSFLIHVYNNVSENKRQKYVYLKKVINKRGIEVFLTIIHVLLTTQGQRIVK